MGTDLIVAVFCQIAIVAQPLLPTYLLAVFELRKIIRNRTSEN